MADAGKVVSSYAGSFIGAFIAITIALALVPSLLNTVGNISGVPLLTTAIVGTVIGAGIVLFLVKQFI